MVKFVLSNNFSSSFKLNEIIKKSLDPSYLLAFFAINAFFFVCMGLLALLFYYLDFASSFYASLIGGVAILFIVKVMLFTVVGSIYHKL